MTYLAKAISHGSKLKKLNLTSTKLTYKGCFSLFQALQRQGPPLRELVLDKNNIDGKRLRITREMLYNNKHLEVLQMNQC